MIAWKIRPSTSPDNTFLNAANEKADQSLLDFQVGIGIGAHATLQTKQCISHMTSAITDSITFLQDSKEDVQEVYNLLGNILDNLD